MKRIIVLMLICIVSINAGILDSSKVVLPKAGSQSLEFGMSGLFSLSSYVGNTIAIKNFSSPLKATRYMVYIRSDGYQHTGDRDEMIFLQSLADTSLDTAYYDYSSKANRHDAFLGIQWLKYQNPYGSLSLLYGVGPLIGFEYSDRENALDPRRRTTNTTLTQDRDVSAGVYLGLLPVIGIEWFLHKNLSFHAEYYTMMRFGWRDITDEYYREYSADHWFQNNSDLSGLYYSVRGYARGGISFYFK